VDTKIDEHIALHVITSADLDAANLILNEAYGPSNYGPKVARYLALQPDGWLMAHYDGIAAGMAGAINYGSFAYIGMVGTRPSMQRKGIALTLMRYVLEWLESQGCHVSLLDATLAGAQLYKLLDFHEEHKAFRVGLENYVPSGEIPPAVRQLSLVDLSEVVSFDTPRFGVDRHNVIHQYMIDFPDRVFGNYDEQGQLRGYSIAQDALIGPWMADSPDAAESLLQATLTLPFDEPPGVIFQEPNNHAALLLANYGFTQQRIVAHMRRGGTHNPRHVTTMYGQATFALG
jgi:GNAT superfamily N-acetyltransferase